MCNMYMYMYIHIYSLYIQPKYTAYMQSAIWSSWYCPYFDTSTSPPISRLYFHCSFVTQRSPTSPPPWFFRSFSRPYSFPNSAAGAPRDVNKSPMDPRVPPKDTPGPLGFFVRVVSWGKQDVCWTWTRNRIEMHFGCVYNVYVYTHIVTTL